jgi:hypothetical protein
MGGSIKVVIDTPLAWILIAGHRHWSYWRKGMMSLIVLVPLCLASIVFSLVLNGIITAIGLQ